MLMRDSVLELISSMRLDSRKEIQSVKSAWSVLHAELKARVHPLNRGTINYVKRTHTEWETKTKLPKLCNFYVKNKLKSEIFNDKTC